MITIPDRYSYFECYLTLRCQMNCPYCINQHTGVTRKRKELSAKEWCLALNNIDTHGLPITLGGGEPTIHKEFYEIVNGLNPDKKIDLLTNGLAFDLKEFMDRIPPERFTKKGYEYKAIRMSYHPKTTDREELLMRAKTLQESGYPVGIFGVNHPENLAANVEMTARTASYGIYFFVRDFLGYYDDRLYGYYKYRSALNGNRKRCQCKIEELLVGPDGDAYRCHRDLYDGSCSIGSIMNMAFEVKDIFRPCDNYGLCNPCDIKLKLSNDLTTRKCSVEIVEA